MTLVPARRSAGLPQMRRPPVASRPAVRSVCLYTCSFNPSGMGWHMLALAEEYVAAGLDVSVAFWPAPAAEALMSRAAGLGATLIRTPHPRDPAYADELTAAFGAVGPDVLHVHVGTGREDFGGARAAKRAGVPAVVETLHLPWLMRDSRRVPGLLRTLREVDRIVTVSERQAQTYRRIGVPATAMTTIRNGVPPRGPGRVPGPGRDEARRRLGLGPDQPVVLTTGRLVDQKGQRYLVDAVPALVSAVPDLAVVIVGGGPLEGALRHQAEELGVGGAVRLAGHREDARTLLQAADVYALPSLAEAMPLALLEAMEAGLAAVGTAIIGTDEVLEDGATGLLVPPRDPRALGDALLRLLRDPALRRTYGAAARRRYETCFTARRMAEQTLQVYDEALTLVGAGRLAVESPA
jgi:glycosyltransferase involved in cell wall biosynthesis